MTRTLAWVPIDSIEAMNEQMREHMVAMRRYVGIAIMDFYQDNVAAGLSASIIRTTGGEYNIYIMPRAGHVIGFAAKINEARTAGTLTVEARLGGTVLTDAQVVIDATNTTENVVRLPATLDNAFEALEELRVVVTTDGSWAPTTADLVVCVMLQFTMED